MTNESSSTSSETRRPRSCCPYGPLIAAPIFCSWVAWSFLYSAAYSCQYMFIYIKSYQGAVYRGDDDDDEEPNNVSDFGIGLWSVEYEEVCEDYSYRQVEADAPITAARIAAIIATIVGFFGFLSVCIAGCVAFSFQFRRVVAISLIVAGTFTFLLLVFLATGQCTKQLEAPDPYNLYQYECEADAGLILGVLSAILFIGAGVTTFYLELHYEEPRNTNLKKLRQWRTALAYT